jgi:hypothetical protein
MRNRGVRDHQGHQVRIIHENVQRLGMFASKTVGAGRLDRTKNAAQANDRARNPKWLRAAFL